MNITKNKLIKKLKLNNKYKKKNSSNASSKKIKVKGTNKEILKISKCLKNTEPQISKTIQIYQMSKNMINKEIPCLKGI